MNAWRVFATIGLTLACSQSGAIGIARDAIIDPEASAEFWKPCTGEELRCVLRDALDHQCPSDVTLGRLTLPGDGQPGWYAWSRHGGGMVRVADDPMMYSAEFGAALDAYASMGVSEVNWCEAVKFASCHIWKSGDAGACRQWAAAAIRPDRMDTIGTCAREDGLLLMRAPTNTGDCKWTPPEEELRAVSNEDFPVAAPMPEG